MAWHQVPLEWTCKDISDHGRVRPIIAAQNTSFAHFTYVRYKYHAELSANDTCVGVGKAQILWRIKVNSPPSYIGFSVESHRRDILQAESKIETLTITTPGMNCTHACVN